jgi:hypothetical protein
MPIALAIFAVLIAVASASGVLFPAEILSFAREMIVGSGWWWAAGARLILAVLLWFSAPVSRTPITFRVLAILALLGATFIVAVGSEGVLEIVDWLATWPLWGVRLESAVGVVFGVFLLWSVTRKRADA